MLDVHRTIEAVWRMESAKLIAVLTHMVRDLGLAEDLAQDALVKALEKWPCSGIPDKPGAWLMAIAKNRAIDHLRRQQRLRAKIEQIGKEQDATVHIQFPNLDNALERPIDDDMLSLVFIACHPVLSSEARVSLTLKVLAGLSTEEIARAYLVQSSAIAQRITRAKRTLTEAKVRFEVPQADELAPRLESVLEVIYLIFNEGYAATSGEHWTRPELCEEALRLGRIVAGLLPEASEVHGLVALMEIQSSRLAARIGPNGDPVLLLDQNRGRWDQLLIQRGLSALVKAEQTAPSTLGNYALQAEIAACHARARSADATDWGKIAALYDALSQINPSPVVELNRAVALSMTYGPQAGLDIVDSLVGEPTLAGYHLLPAVRADLLLKMGRLDAAAVEFSRAAELTHNSRERHLLESRAVNCLTGSADQR